MSNGRDRMYGNTSSDAGSVAAKRRVAIRDATAGLTACLVVTAFVLFWASARENRSLVRVRSEQHLAPVEPLENAPPLVVFTTVVLGGFRGLIADALWLRASRLQDEGRYFELVQLADWITKLEPRMSEVWAYHAWNLAYNISVLMTEPSDRWRWVRSGIELLRDRGLLYNAGDPKIHIELGLLFYHKIGGMTDEAHAYYKRQWIDEITELLGGARPDYEALMRDPERLRRVRSKYKLEPDIMRQIDETYGALDWRLPQSHAVYWAYKGKRLARGVELLNCHRIIYQSLADLFKLGKLEYLPDEQRYVFGPNLNFLPHVLAAYETALAEVKEEETFVVSYANFLRRAVYIAHELGQTETSRELFDLLHRRFPAADTAAGYENFVAGRREMEKSHP